MKDLLASFFEAIFNNGDEEDFSFKRILIMALKVMIFIIITLLGIWIALKLKK